jgi:nucleotide-binding universal stress UspA family protein
MSFMTSPSTSRGESISDGAPASDTEERGQTGISPSSDGAGHTPSLPVRSLLVGSLLVGVAPGQPDAVARTAIEWAARMGLRRIHFVYVDPTMTSASDGYMEPLDSDSLDESRARAADELSRRMMSLDLPPDITSDFTVVPGDPADGLRGEADRSDAIAIVVGTRERGPLAAIEEWMRGSVSVRLEHIQARPIIVVPLKGSYDAGNDAEGRQ